LKSLSIEGIVARPIDENAFRGLEIDDVYGAIIPLEQWCYRENVLYSYTS